jgi:hypothetical protein
VSVHVYHDNEALTSFSLHFIFHDRTHFTLHHSLSNMLGYRFKISYLHAGKVIGQYCSEELYESETACRNAAEKVDYDYCCGFHIEVLPEQLASTHDVKAD